ncbi:MAG: SMC-Scp complex subunit ScpB [Candidatus Caldarchaeum sp.]|nr:SMC-Scp complex subunit ScpB [Candidatus Caldarchaeum sp.]
MDQTADVKLVAEALLFASDKPVHVKTLQRALKTRSTEKVKKIIQTLMQEYSGRAVEIIELDGDRFFMRLRPDLLNTVKKYTRRKVLPHGVLKTLATIAYYQPLPLSTLAAIRGKDSYRQLKILVERGLVETEKKGRTSLLRTTSLFADFFGVENTPSSIKSLIERMIASSNESGLKHASEDVRRNGSVAQRHSQKKENRLESSSKPGKEKT